jgi:hypothetical protein
MRTAVLPVGRLKAKSIAHRKIPFPKEARVDRRNPHRSRISGSDSPADHRSSPELHLAGNSSGRHAVFSVRGRSYLL